MKLIISSYAALCFGSLSFATSVAERSLDDQVHEATFIVVGQVKDVTMTGRFGWPIRDANAITGPGGPNTIWLRVEFDRTAVLKGEAASIPPTKKLPLWQGWIKDLRSEKEVSLGKSFVFFLSSDAKPASEQFQHFEFERADIEKAISRQKKKPNQPPEPTPLAGTPAAGAPDEPAKGVARQ